jgi:hypothetical protein
MVQYVPIDKENEKANNQILYRQMLGEKAQEHATQMREVALSVDDDKDML